MPARAEATWDLVAERDQLLADRDRLVQQNARLRERLATLSPADRDLFAASDLLIHLERWGRDWPDYWVKADSQEPRLFLLRRRPDGSDAIVLEVVHCADGGYRTVPV